MQGKIEDAKERYKEALSVSRKNGSEEGAREANAALRRLQGGELNSLAAKSSGSLHPVPKENQ